MSNLLATLAAAMLTLLDIPLSGMRTRFLKSLRTAPSRPVTSTGLRALKPGASNDKLGRGPVTRGPAAFLGRIMYQLTLEERATCPETCAQLLRCYGDNVPFAVRFVVNEALYAAVRADLDTLDRAHPEGYIVRLHVLGDFKNLAYLGFWRTMLAEHAGLSIYGYTHWPANSRIGSAIADLAETAGGRFAVLRSDGAADGSDRIPVAIVVKDWSDLPAGIVPCPEMTGQAASCVACGLCMNGRTSVGFIDHGAGTKKAALVASLLRAYRSGRVKGSVPPAVRTAAAKYGLDVDNPPARPAAKAAA